MRGITSFLGATWLSKSLRVGVLNTYRAPKGVTWLKSSVE